MDLLSHMEESNTELNRIFMTLSIFFVVGSISGYIRSYCFTLTGYRVVKRLRTRLFDSIIKQDMDFFDQQKTGDLLSRLSSDTQVIQSSLTVNVSMFVRFSAQAIGSIVILFGLSWKLTLVMFSSKPLFHLLMAIE